MNENEIFGWHFLTRQPLRVRWHDGQITAVDPAPALPPKELWLAPPLTDLQVNGYGGVDFQDPALTEELLLTAVRKLNRDCCAQLLVTLTTNDWTFMLRQVKRVREWRARTPELQAAIAGFHLEGPFMSPAAGYCGAHNPNFMLRPAAAHLHALREAAGDCALLLTVAPEQPGVLEAIPLAISLGMRISLGHTNAPADTIQAAQSAGAQAFTHLANGCPQALDRHDNIVWRALNAPGLWVGLIPDLIHVSPLLLRVLHRALDTSRIWYTTDAVSPAGMPPGRFKFGELVFEVGPDQIVREPGKTNFAGSALRPIEGVFRAAATLGRPWQETWVRYSRQPRELMGLDVEQLAPGKPASFCMLDFSQPQSATVRTYIHGALCSTLPARARLEGAGF